MQLDMFEETLEKKIFRMEKWIGRLQKELTFLKEVYIMSKKAGKFDTIKKHAEQIDLFSA